MLRIVATRRGAHVLSSSRLSLTSVYWYCAWLMRPPSRTSCVACKNSVAPGTCASLGRSRAITSSAEILRSARGLSETNMRPVLLVVPRPPPPPVKAVAASTAGSFCTMSTKRTILSRMAANDTSCAATSTPAMRPLSCCGKKPFGTITKR